MYHAFSRRLTSWYVGAAVIGALVVVLAFAVLSMVLYTRLLDESAEGIASAARDAGVRAAHRQEPFTPTALLFERRNAHAGILISAVEHPPRPFGPPAQRRGSVLVNGVVRTQRPPRPMGWESPGMRYGAGWPPGGRLGMTAIEMLGGRPRRVAFDGGEMIVMLDPRRLEDVGARLAAGVVLLTILAGVGAWLVGRYITSQVLRPLVDVTRSLRRFAARDFTPEPIALAGKSEFDELAQAYNGAAAQVDAAFAERAQAEARMRQFVADAGHELRTPLAIVLGFVDVLRRKVDPREGTAGEAFSSIDAQGRRMRSLIDNLILLARMESPQAKPIEPFTLGPLLDEIVNARRILADHTQIELDLGVDATIVADRDEIHEALENVVDNALKYAPGAPIEILTRALDPATIEIAIRDGGPGIPLEHVETIFERFFRAMPHRGEIEGSGLGLAIARRAAERAGGGLALIANGPRGATFAFRLRALDVRTREPALSS
jgi:signal transduction histidine kinase